MPLKQDNSDEALMERYADGDITAFEELLSRHRRPLFGYLCRMLGNHQLAEDTFQEIFLRIIHSRRRYTRTAGFSSWLYRIAHNSCMDVFRREKYRKTQSLEEPVQDSDGHAVMLQDLLQNGNPAPDEALEHSQLSEALKKCVDSLAPDQREVFILRQYQNLSFKDIARAVQTSESTVKSRMRYALKNLRGMLIEQRVIEEVSS